MMWENSSFWNGENQCYDDIDPRKFDWWCPECEMAIQDCHAVDGRCPQCGEDLIDIDDEIDTSKELKGEGDLTQDEEGNWCYRDDM